MKPASSRSAWPNLFIVGAAHAGTTSLWRNLGHHPDVWMAPVKEPNFFSAARRPLNQNVHDEASYLSLFARGAMNHYRGEASCSYLFSTDVPSRIRGVSPEARILISLRDPVDRTYSCYWYGVRIGIERSAFAEAVRSELDGTPDRLLVSSLYATNVERYLQTFPGAVHVLFLEDWMEDPERVMRDVFEFLGIDPEPADRVDREAHNRHSLPRNRLARIVHNSPRIRAAARRVAPRSVRRRAQEALLRPAAKDQMSPEIESELKDRFAPDVQRLQDVLGEEVPWPRFRAASRAA